MDLFPDPTLGSLPIQAYSNLAMGAGAIEHFLWQACTGMRAAPYGADGVRTPTYELVQQLNRELQAQAGVFLGSKFLYTPRWSGPNPPKGYEAYKPSGVIQSLNVGARGALISSLSKDNYRFLVIVNQDFLAPMPLDLTCQPQARIGRVQKDGTVKALGEPRLQCEVDPGNAVILMWMTTSKQTPQS